MSEPVPREWRFFIDDMIASAEKVVAYTRALDQAGFVISGMNYDATLRNLELIGEAAPHIPEDVRSANPQIPWRLVIATRNRLIHGYLGIDNAGVGVLRRRFARMGGDRTLDGRRRHGGLLRVERLAQAPAESPPG